jgi:hypothetical protein
MRIRHDCQKNHRWIDYRKRGATGAISVEKKENQAENQDNKGA